MYFQPCTAHIIFVFMIQPKQDGPPFPHYTSHIVTSLCLCQQHSFFLEYPPLFYREVYLIPSNSSLSLKSGILLIIFPGTSWVEVTPLSLALSWHFTHLSPSHVQIYPTLYRCHMSTCFSWGLGLCGKSIFVFFTTSRVDQWLARLTQGN